ncbi:MAG: hypothetical protein R3Y63_03460 [Eubacteriales bacterium]
MKLFDNLFSAKVLEGIYDETMSMEELEEIFLNEKEDFSLEDWLKQENLSLEEVEEKRITWQKELIHLGEKFQFNLDDSFQTCISISEVEVYTKDLGRLLRLYLPEQGSLLQAQSKQSTDEFIFAMDQFEEVEKNLSIIESLSESWNFIVPQLFKKNQVSLPKTNVSTKELWNITKIFTDKLKGNGVFLYNLETLISDLNSYESLRKVAPLYLYQIIVNHVSRLQTNKDISVNLESLFRYKHYEIDKDNGKNFHKNRDYLRLFAQLCSLFEKDNSVNIPLSQWGFMKLSNLLEFDRSETEVKSTCVVPFFDVFMEDSLFSCIKDKEAESIVKETWGFSLKQVRYFQSQPVFHSALDEISAYLNKNALQYYEKYLNYKVEQIEELCQEIYFFSGAQKMRKPKSERELKLFLSVIYLGLLELKDYFGKEYLILGLIGIFR